MTYDDNGSNVWSTSTLATYLNGDYLNTIDTTNIVSHSFNVGEVGNDTSSLSSTVSEEKSNTWSGNVGLITVSDYLRSNSNVSSCSTIDLNWDNYETCQSTSYLFTSDYDWWIMSPVAVAIDSIGSEWNVGPSGDFGHSYLANVNGL